MRACDLTDYHDSASEYAWWGVV